MSGKYQIKNHKVHEFKISSSNDDLLDPETIFGPTIEEIQEVHSSIFAQLCVYFSLSWKDGTSEEIYDYSLTMFGMGMKAGDALKCWAV